MAKNIFRKINLNASILALIASLLGACANSKPPSGGPDDLTPPSVEEVYPTSSTTNFKNFPIKVKFSEWLDKASVAENVKISPEAKLKLSWSGKTLHIKPAEPLKENTTYCVSLSPDYKDLSGNKPRSEYSMIFSTGNQIDSGKIMGKVATPAVGYSVFYYNIDKINPDTLNIANTLPDGRIKIGSSGTFNIQAMKNGRYRIFLVNDRNDDKKYNEGYEELAAACRDIELNDAEKSNYFSFYSAKMYDKIPPELLSAVSTAARTLKLTFSEPVSENSIQPSMFAVCDSLGVTKAKAEIAYRAKSDTNVVFVLLDQKLSANMPYRCEITSTVNSALRDTAGNAFQVGTVKSEIFTASPDEEVGGQVSFVSSVKDSAKNVSPDEKFVFTFSKPLAEKCKVEGLELVQTEKSRNIPVKYEFLNGNRLEIMPEKPLKSYTQYKLNFAMNGGRAAFSAENLPDTTISISFTTEDRRLRGTLSGKIIGEKVDTNGRYYVILSNGRKTLYAAADDTLGWKFNELPEGDYTINLFLDENGNGEFDAGDAFPYQKAEKFYLLERKVKIIQRWNVADFIIELKD